MPTTTRLKFGEDDAIFNDLDEVGSAIDGQD